MNVMEIIKKVPWKKVVKFAGCVGAGVMAFAEARDAHKKEVEFEALKKAVAELKGKES